MCAWQMRETMQVHRNILLYLLFIFYMPELVCTSVSAGISGYIVGSRCALVTPILEQTHGRATTYPKKSDLESSLGK
jgi:hypothetical protein